MTDSIYGLIDPRRPDWVMYVGKGSEKRARSHWKEFTGGGRGINSLLRHWFEQLRVDSIEPSFIFLEENVSNWQEAERDWIAAWRKVNSQLCNVADGGNAPYLSPEKIKDICSRAGKIGGRIGGRATKEITNGRAGNGGIRAHQLHPKLYSELGRKNIALVHRLYPDLAKETMTKTNKKYPDLAHRAGAIGGKIGGKVGGPIAGRKNVESGHWASLKTKEHQSKAGSVGGKIGGVVSTHNRYHILRNIQNPNCSLCCKAWVDRRGDLVRFFEIASGGQ